MPVPPDNRRPIALPDSPDSDSPVDLEEEGAMLAAAMAASSSPGMAGRMQLLHRWRTLPPEKRVMLILLAREMAGSGRGG